MAGLAKAKRRELPELSARQTKKILMMAINFAPEVTGPAPYTSGLARALAKAGFEIEVITSHPHYPEWRIHDGYGQWSSLEIDNALAINRRLHYVPEKPFGLRRALSEITFGLRLVFASWKNSDAIILVTPALLSSALVAFRNSFSPRPKPLIVWVQDLYSAGLQETGVGGNLVTRIFTKIEAWLFTRAQIIVAIHERFANKISNEFNVSQKKIQVVRNWSHSGISNSIDLQKNRGELGWREDDFLVLHTGNMGLKQGLENVIATARILAKEDTRVKFVLIGDGAMKQELQRKASGLTNVQFFTLLEEDVFQKALNCANAFLINELPGVGEMSLPSKLTTYLAAAKPIIAAVNPRGITAEEVAKSGAGTLVISGDPQALADATKKLAHETTKLRDMSSAAMHYSREILSEDRAFNAFAEILESVTRKSKI